MKILCIDTALESAHVGVAVNGKLVTQLTNSSQSDHAAWIHTAIRTVTAKASIDLHQLDAVAVTSGPGSYTGLRVGMATAKGLCYALHLPLVTENILELTAVAAYQLEQTIAFAGPVLYCPMIDARRMEVFTAMYNDRLEEVTRPSAVILDEQSFASELDEHSVVFCGNGSKKWRAICQHKNAVFADVSHQPEDFAMVATKKCQQRQFANLAYSEPDYFKNFYSGS